MPETLPPFTYEDLVDYAATGYFGTHYEHLLEGLGGGEGSYTVYWPRDSIRVIHGSSYAVARTMFCLLSDARTYWMGEPMSVHKAEIALIRRELAPSGGSIHEAHVRGRPTVYQRDRMLPWDITTRGADRFTDRWGPARQVFDFSTLPDDIAP